MITMLAVLVLAGGDVLSPIPEDGLMSLELTLGRRRACSIPSVRCCHIGLLPLLPELMLWQGRVVLSANAGLSQANDGLPARGVVKLSRRPAFTPSVGVGVIFFHRRLARRKSLYEGRVRWRRPRKGQSEGGAPLRGRLLVG
jgi:hypothetical protein